LTLNHDARNHVFKKNFHSLQYSLSDLSGS